MKILSILLGLFSLLFVFIACTPPKLEISIKHSLLEEYSNIKKMSISAVQPKPFFYKTSKLQNFKINEPFSELPCSFSNEEKSFPPFLYLEAFSAQGLSFSGRFLLSDACRTLKAFIFLYPQDEFAPLYIANYEVSSDDLARTGHSITKLPDNRYLIAGGVREIYFEEQKNTKFVKTTLIYDPQYHSLKQGPVLPHGLAFHSATLIGNEIIFLGGLTEKDSISTSFSIQIDSSGKLSPVSSTALSKRYENPYFKRFFHQLLVLGETSNRVSLPLGGFSKTLQELKTCHANRKCEGLQLAFHSTTYLPERKSVILLGGVIFNHKTGRFSMNPYGWELKEKDLLEGQINLTSATSFTLDYPRAGHTVLPIDKNSFLVFGGFAIPQNSLNPLNIKHIFNDALLVRFDSDIHSSSSSPWGDIPLSLQADQISPRMFHSMTRLYDGRILISGGIQSVGQDFQLNEFALLLTPTKDKNLSEPHFNVTKIAMESRRFWHTSTFLPTGQVLLFGGLSNITGSNDKFSLHLFSSTEEIEIFNPTLNAPK